MSREKSAGFFRTFLKLNDVIDGYITAEQAKGDYGVVIDARAMKVDEQETANV